MNKEQTIIYQRLANKAQYNRATFIKSLEGTGLKREEALSAYDSDVQIANQANYCGGNKLRYLGVLFVPFILIFLCGLVALAYWLFVVPQLIPMPS
jgi:hypothetical protein